MEKAQKNEGWQTAPKERYGYYSFYAGQGSIYTLVSMFLTTYLLFLGVDSAKTATVMLAVKLWDAVNDAVFGVVFDRIKFKSGKKYLPWLRLSCALVPITTILLFLIPAGGSEALKLGWFAVAYLLWDTAYTLCDVPLFSYISVLTPHQGERTSILSYKTILYAVGTAFAYVLATVLVSESVGLNFGVVAVLVGVFAAATMLPLALKGKERAAAPEEEAFTLKRMFRYLFQNKYLLLYYLGFLFYAGLGTGMSLSLFVSYYLFQNSLFSLILIALSALPSLFMALLVPKLTKRFDKMKIYLVCLAALTVLTLVTWLVGYESVWLFLALSVLKSIPTAIIGVMMFMFTPDCAEYGKFKSGIEAKGITFAIQTFMAKLTAAISGSLGLLLLGLFQWKSVEVESFQELEALGLQQSAGALNGLWFTYMLVPAIGMAIAFLIWCFYRLPDKDVQIMTDCNRGVITREDAEAALSKKYD